jgi:L-asparaginase II
MVAGLCAGKGWRIAANAPVMFKGIGATGAPLGPDCPVEMVRAVSPAELLPLVELTRGGHSECLHFGAIAVVDKHGAVLAHAGNPQFVSFTRSTLKVLQALPLLQTGAAKALGLSQSELALLCASHNGEPMHVQTAESILAKAGQDYRVLRCGCHVPGLFTLLDKAPPEGLVYDERHHNCSGKHAGFVALCVQQGWPVADYTEPAHPLQQAVRSAVARAVGMNEADMPMGIDGCSAPNYAMPLARLAHGYARLATGAADAEFGDSFALLGEAMTAHPDLVSGTGRNDLAFMRAGRGDWISKIGADGVQVMSSKSRGEAFAIKISDGNKPALYAATVAVLEQLGWMDEGQAAELDSWRGAEIFSARGVAVGERRVCFTLRSGT